MKITIQHRMKSWQLPAPAEAVASAACASSHILPTSISPGLKIRERGGLRDGEHAHPCCLSRLLMAPSRSFRHRKGSKTKNNRGDLLNHGVCQLCTGMRGEKRTSPTPGFVLQPLSHCCGRGHKAQTPTRLPRGEQSRAKQSKAQHPNTNPAPQQQDAPSPGKQLCREAHAALPSAEMFNTD